MRLCIPGAQAPASDRLMLMVPSPMLVRIPHHHCEQSGALRICVPKLEFGNKEQSRAELCGYVFPNWSLGTRNKVPITNNQ